MLQIHKGYFVVKKSGVKYSYSNFYKLFCKPDILSQFTAKHPQIQKGNFLVKKTIKDKDLKNLITKLYL